MSDRTVLIVDDQEGIRKLLTRWLAQWDYASREVGTAEEALAAMEDAQADIILCDIGLPGHDGLWLAEQVHERWSATAIVMATGIDASAVVRASRKLGAVAYVRKPFDPTLLRQAIDRAAGRLHFRSSVESTT
jgi:DNA-binding NtrC family response regulator